MGIGGAGGPAGGRGPTGESGPDRVPAPARDPTREQVAFHPDGPQRALQLPAGLFGIERTAADGSERIRVLANLTAEPLEVRPEKIDHHFDRRQWNELIEGWSCAGVELRPLRLAPYQVMWLQG